MGPRYPHLVVLVGATGDLSRRKLLPGLFHLANSGFIPGCRIIGVSLDEMDAESFRGFARAALTEFSHRPVSDEAWASFAAALDYVPLKAGPAALKAAADRAELTFSSESRRLHYLSVPPSAALSAARMLGEAGLIERSRVIMEKTVRHRSGERRRLEREPARRVHRATNLSHSTTSWAKSQRKISSRFASPTACSNQSGTVTSSITCKSTCPRTLGLGKRVGFYETVGAFRDMVVTHLFQILAFMAMEPPTSLEPNPISEEKNKVFRCLLPLLPEHVVRRPIHRLPGRKRACTPSPTPRRSFALKCFIDNWRWAGVPFYLRTGKRLAEGQRIISIAFREPPKSMFPAGSGRRLPGPRSLDLRYSRTASRCRSRFTASDPGRALRLDKLSLQFAMHDTGHAGEVLEAYERLILDAMRGDYTLFTTAEGIETLWEKSTPLLEAPPPVRMYSPGSWGPNVIHSLVAPHAWRLPFERAWRAPNPTGD